MREREIYDQKKERKNAYFEILFHIFNIHKKWYVILWNVIDSQIGQQFIELNL